MAATWTIANARGTDGYTIIPDYADGSRGNTHRWFGSVVGAAQRIVDDYEVGADDILDETDLTEEEWSDAMAEVR